MFQAKLENNIEENCGRYKNISNGFIYRSFRTFWMQGSRKFQPKQGNKHVIFMAGI